jgi:hypothetical protein
MRNKNLNTVADASLQLRRIMCRASNQTPDTIPRGPAPQEETLSERVAVAAAFVFCVALIVALGGVL